MKRLWKKLTGLRALNDRIEVDLTPQQVTARRSHWLARSAWALASEQIAPAPGEPAWRGAIDAFERILKEWEPLRGSLEVTLSNRFVRYLLVPAHSELKQAEEQTEYARHFFVERYGAHAEEWIIKLAPGDREGCLFACAIERRLMDELNRVASAHYLKLRLVEPALVKVFNISRERVLASPCWLVVVEPGIAGLGLIADGAWVGVTTRRLQHPIDEGLTRLLATEQHVLGIEFPIEKVLVARYCLKHDFPRTLSDLNVETLPDCGLAAA